MYVYIILCLIVRVLYRSAQDEGAENNCEKRFHYILFVRACVCLIKTGTAAVIHYRITEALLKKIVDQQLHCTYHYYCYTLYDYCVK